MLRLGGCSGLAISLDGLWGDVSLSSWADGLKLLDLRGALAKGQALPTNLGGLQYLRELLVRGAACCTALSGPPSCLPVRCPPPAGR